MTLAGEPIAVEIGGLTKTFGDKVVLGGVDLTIPSGQFVALLGRSGTGKSTLLRILAGLDSEATGRVEVPTNRSVAFQDARLLPWKRVAANVALGRSGASPSQVRAALEEVGLSERHGAAWPRALSGGELQRASLARALLREPELLLLDEPLGALDALTRIRMQSLLTALQQRHRSTVVMVTHDIEEAILVADRILVLDEGRFVLDVQTPPAPRRRTSPVVTRLRDELLASIRVEDDHTNSTPTEQDDNGNDN